MVHELFLLKLAPPPPPLVCWRVFIRDYSFKYTYYMKYIVTHKECQKINVTPKEFNSVPCYFLPLKYFTLLDQEVVGGSFLLYNTGFVTRLFVTKFKL